MITYRLTMPPNKRGMLMLSLQPVNIYHSFPTLRTNSLNNTSKQSTTLRENGSS